MWVNAVRRVQMDAIAVKSHNQDSQRKSNRGITWSLIAAIVLAVYLAAHLSSVTAQSGMVKWSPPENISNTPQSSAYPAIAADDFGNVHVFWSEDIDGRPLGPSDPSDSGNAIYYTRWDGTVWTAPIDILYSPDDSVASYPAVAVDKKGTLHLVWTGLTDIYYSQAPGSQAQSSRVWRQPVVVATNSARSNWESSIAVDNEGNLHIAYATRGSGAGIYHVASTDNGATWSQPVKISDPFDMLEASVSGVKLIMDGKDRLHVVWQTNTADGFGQAAYYAQSTDGGNTWSSPYQLSYRQTGDFYVGYPYPVQVGPDELHIIYIAGANTGRWERISRDGGLTWSEPQYIIPEMEGINGYVIPVVDSAGHAHLIINMRPSATQEVGIYYSYWDGERWSVAMPLANSGPEAESAHFAAAAVSMGNEIHVVWNQVRGGEIWHIQGLISDVKPGVVQPLPTITPTRAPTPIPVAIVSQAQFTYPSLNQAPVSNVNSALNAPVIPGTLAALAFLVLVIVVVRQRRSDRSAK